MTTTPNLGLTQYAGTDTINFLTQYNDDLDKIDTSAKMTKAIGSDYIYSYTTPPTYASGTFTLTSGTKFVPAYGIDINGDINQTIYTLSTNKTIAITGTADYDIYIDETQTMSKVLTSNYGMVSFIANLPTTVATTEPYVYYVVNEHRYYYTSGSTTASWSAKIYCKVASVRVVSNVITYFKPNLQQNLAQKISKDKLLFTMAEVTANTDKEFVPSATAVKEMNTTLTNELVNIGTSTLLTTITTTTLTTVAVANMTAFKWIYVEFINSNLVVDARTVPFDIFDNAVKIQLNTYYESYSYGDVEYVDSTHIKSNVLTAGLSIKIYGIK